nr:MAG TPA: protein of unknown function (DUF5461) [Bacteriophage sp.]
MPVGGSALDFRLCRFGGIKIPFFAKVLRSARGTL